MALNSGNYSRKRFEQFSDGGDFYFTDPATDTYTYSYPCGHVVSIKGSELASGKKVSHTCKKCGARSEAYKKWAASEYRSAFELLPDLPAENHGWLDREIMRVRRLAYT